MPVPVNLYVDRLSMAPPAHLTDVYYATSEHPAEYKEAAARIGLTAEEYKEFRAALLDGNALYVKLPRRLDSMAGMHRRNHQVYALSNVVVPAGTMGWQVQLADGTQVYVPQVCGNLSMIRHGAIAKTPVRRTVAVRPRKQVKRVAAERAERPSAPALVPPPAPAAPAESPVTFDNPATQVAVIPAAVPVAAGVAAHHFPFAALLLPLVKAFGGGGGTGPSSSGGGGGFFGGGGGGTGGGICPKK